MIFILATSLVKSLLSSDESADRKSIEYRGNEELNREYVMKVTSISDLETAVVEEGITGVGSQTFQDFKKLSSVSLPMSCKYLGYSSFRGCSSLKSITLPEGLEKINDYCFGNAGLVNISFPTSFVSPLSGYTFYGCSYLKNFFVSEENGVYSASKDYSILIYNRTTVCVGFGASATIRIPEEIEEIGEYFLNGRTPVNKVDFGDNSHLKSIKENAFRYTSITRLTLPAGIINISSIFSGVTTIEYIFFPKSLENIGDFFSVIPEVVDVEEGCAAVMIDERGIIYDKDGKKMIYLPQNTKSVYIDKNVEDIMYNSIRKIVSIVNITVDKDHEKYAEFDGILYSKNYSILYCCIGGLRKTTLHRNCTIISTEAFSETIIESVNMSCSNITEVPDSTFSRASKLRHLEFCESLTQIGRYALVGTNITIIIFPHKLKTLGTSSCGGSMMRIANFSKCTKLKVIPGEAFQRCKELEECILPPNLESLAISAFKSCTKLVKIIIPSKVSVLSQDLFMDCTSLSEVTFEGNMVKIIPMNCFKSCNLSSFSLPSSVVMIETESFMDNKFLSNFMIDDDSNLVSILVDAFAGCDHLKTIFLGEKVTDLSLGALSQMDALEEIRVSTKNERFSSKNGVLFSKDGKVLESFPGGLKEFCIDAGVERIASRAFFRCSKLVSLEFDEGSSLRSIGGYTFYGCTSLAQVEIPGSVSEVEEMAFAGCSSLANVTFERNSLVTEVQSGVFEGCVSLQSVVFEEGSRLTRIEEGAFAELAELEVFEAPPSLREIGARSFSGCKRLSHFLFVNITRIGESAFMGSGLTHVILGVNIEEVGRDAFRGCWQLLSVSYCGISKTNLENVEALTGFKGSVYVSVSYNKKLLLGQEVIRILDGDCRFPTAQFTVDVNTSVAHVMCILQDCILYSSS